MLKKNSALLVVICAFLAFSASGAIEHKENTLASSTITLNNESMTVFFNDADTFRIQSEGELKDVKVRVAGYNSLETYGPVHAWMDNSLEYLFKNAKLATKKAREGNWTCTSEGQKDVYGRMLAECDDLAVALIKAGLAHAYSIDENPAKELYLTAQKQAQDKSIGMWKYGIPDYIIASLHSAAEGAKKTYNRLISTADGTTKTWQHKTNYATCELVCVETNDSCMVYVPFEYRYGQNRPECLLAQKQ